jgi:hypothetical protein
MRSCFAARDSKERLAPPIAHQQAALGTERRGDRDDKRDGETERVRTGDHQHCYYALDHKRGILSGERPAHQRHASGENRDDGEKKAARSARAASASVEVARARRANAEALAKHRRTRLQKALIRRPLERFHVNHH